MAREIQIKRKNLPDTLIELLLAVAKIFVFRFVILTVGFLRVAAMLAALLDKEEITVDGITGELLVASEEVFSTEIGTSKTNLLSTISLI